MDVLAAVVSADSVALVSLWEAPTAVLIIHQLHTYVFRINKSRKLITCCYGNTSKQYQNKVMS
jgi:hypothetical protein